MSQFLVYFQIGLKHVLDLNAYDHILFIIALSAAYLFRDWRKLFFLISFFTLGHTFSLLLSVYNLMSIKAVFVEFFISLTILVTALYNIFTLNFSKSKGFGVLEIVSFVFGIIHGFGFSTYFKTILGGSSSSQLIPLATFAIGIEGAQIIVVLTSLSMAYIMQVVFKFSKRDWIIMTSSFIIGVILPMLIERNVF